MTTIGIIGGSGLYDLDGLKNLEEIKVDTPFGPCSDALLKGEFKGNELVFIPRHGRGHRLMPSEIPYQANIYALKKLGVSWAISVSAVGSLKEEIKPGDIAIVKQYIDRTWGRPQSFFGQGIVGHVSMASPCSKALSAMSTDAASACGLNVHTDTTYVCIQGPQFSTRAESHWFRSMNADIIGMTAMPEARLAREAQMHYTTIGLVTDYDCWRSDSDEVDITEILKILSTNQQNLKKMLEELVPIVAKRAPIVEEPNVSQSLKYAVMTDESLIPPAAEELLRVLRAQGPV